MHELALIFGKLGIDTLDVLEAAGSKWNFLPFRPGLAFKENCPDLRNTRVVDIIDALREYSIRVDVYDPWIDRAEAQHEYGLHCLAELPRVAPPLPSPPPPGGGGKRLRRGWGARGCAGGRGQDGTPPRQPDHPSPLAGEGPGERGSTGPFDALILAVAHQEFIAMGAAGLRVLGKAKCILYDVKAVLPADQVAGRL